MKTTNIILVLCITAVLFLTACQKEISCDYPYIQKGFECCLDGNQNDICDDDEESDIEIVENVETIEDYCGDGTCQDNENSCSCQEDCGICSGEVGVCEKYECVDDECIKVKTEDCCGNDICDISESCQTCLEDCGECGSFKIRLSQVVSEDDSDIFNEDGNLIYATITYNNEDYTPAELEQIMPGFSYVLYVEQKEYALTFGKTGKGLVYECTTCLESIYEGNHRVTLRAERLPVKAEDTIDVDFDRLS